MTRQEEISERLREAYMKGQVTVFTDAIAKELALLHDRVDRLANLAADAKQIAAEVERRFDSASFVTAQIERAAQITAGDAAARFVRHVAGLAQAGEPMGDGVFEPTPEDDRETVANLIELAREIAAARGDAPAPARDEVVEAARAVVADADDGVLKSVAGWYPTIQALRAALSAYDAAPDVRSVGSLSDDLTAAAAALSDAAAVRDAALAEAQAVASSFAANIRKDATSPTRWDPDAITSAKAAEYVAGRIAALRSSPPPEPVTEEELMNALHAAPAEAGLFSVQNAARALLAAFTITRKPKD